MSPECPHPCAGGAGQVARVALSGGQAGPEESRKAFFKKSPWFWVFLFRLGNGLLSKIAELCRNDGVKSPGVVTCT